MKLKKKKHTKLKRMTHCKVLDVSQRLNSENALVNPPNEEEKKEISKISHFYPRRRKTGIWFTLPTETTKGVDKVYEILVSKTLAVKHKGMPKREQLHKVSPTIIPAHFCERVSRLWKFSSKGNENQKISHKQRKYLQFIYLIMDLYQK